MPTSLSPEIFDCDDIRPVSGNPRQNCGALIESGRMPALDALRGLAAVLVVFHHFYLTLPAPWLEIAHGWLDWPGLRPIIIGRPAVILFFVLSGFVLTRSLQREAELFPVKFVMRRCLRIYPPFLAAIALSGLLFALIAPVRPSMLSAWFNAQWIGAPDAAILARHAFAQAVGRDTTLDHPIWSLVHEFRFSLVLPFVFMAIRRWGLRNVLLSGGVASIAGFFAATQDAIDPSQHYGGFLFVGGTPVGSVALTIYFSIYFLAGMAVAMRFESCRRALVALPAWLFACACVASLMLLSEWNELAAAIGAVGAILIAAVWPFAHRWLAIWPLQWLGRISYSLYLVHLPVLLAVGHVLSGRAPIVVILVFAFIAALGLAQLFWAWVERPAILLAGRLPAALVTRRVKTQRQKVLSCSTIGRN